MLKTITFAQSNVYYYYFFSSTIAIAIDYEQYERSKWPLAPSQEFCFFSFFTFSRTYISTSESDLMNLYYHKKFFTIIYSIEILLDFFRNFPINKKIFMQWRALAMQYKQELVEYCLAGWLSRV